MIKKLWIAALGSTLLLAGAGEMKLYNVKSGKIDYSIRGSGSVMGMKMKTIGKKRLIFSDYGSRSLTEENKITKQKGMGQEQTKKTHTLSYMNKGIAYRVDFGKQRILRMGNVGAMMGMLTGRGKEVNNPGESMMKQMGGKKTGTDKVLGYSCDVWELMGTKQCLYKGIPLKIETDVMGIKNTEIATKAEFDFSLSNEDFKLPAFPVYDMQGNKLDASKLGKLDEEVSKKAEKSSQDMAEMMQVMADAAKNAGVKEGQRATEQQKKEMENAMMAAMLPRMKEKILSEEKMLRFGYTCLSKADTLKEANICNDKVNAMGGGEREDPFEEWSPETKKETLDFLKKFLDEIIPCVEKARTVQSIKQCMPMNR